MLEDRSIDDLLGEALRRHRLSGAQPPWADLPYLVEGKVAGRTVSRDCKAIWREIGALWIRTLPYQDDPEISGLVKRLRDHSGHAFSQHQMTTCGLCEEAAMAIVKLENAVRKITPQLLSQES
jgi:hypothetical protein